MACFDVLIFLQLNDVVPNLCKALDSNGAVIVPSGQAFPKSRPVWAHSSIKTTVVHFYISYAGKYGNEIMVGLEKVLPCPRSGGWFVALISLQEDLNHTGWGCAPSVAVTE